MGSEGHEKVGAAGSGKVVQLACWMALFKTMPELYYREQKDIP